MRELHSFTDASSAWRMADVLQAQSMPATVEAEGDAFVVWIQNDDDREPARRILAEFLANPDAPEFTDAEQTAKQKQAVARRDAKARQRLQINIRGRWEGVWYRCYPATIVLIAMCSFVVVTCTNWQVRNQSTSFFPATCNDEQSSLRNALFIQSPALVASIPEGDIAIFGPADLWKTIRTGQVWRLVTPIFLHFSVLHLLFNMIWLRDLGQSIEFVRGTRRFVGLVIVIAISSNVAQFLWSAHPEVFVFRAARFGGMSGVVFGLIGYVWMKSRTQPHLGLGLSQNQLVWSVLWMLLCMGGAFGPIANVCHVVGFGTGILIGVRQTFWKKTVAVLKRILGRTDS